MVGVNVRFDEKGEEGRGSGSWIRVEEERSKIGQGSGRSQIRATEEGKLVF